MDHIGDPERQQDAPAPLYGPRLATSTPPPPPRGAQRTSPEGSGENSRKASPPVIRPRPDRPVATWAEVGVLLGAGFFGNIALRSTIGGVAGAAGCALAVILVGRRITRPTAFIPLGVAIALIPWLIVRADPELTAVTFLSIAALLLIAGGFSQSGSIFDTRAAQIARHVLSALLEWTYGLSMLSRLIRSGVEENRAMPLIRGAAIAVPILAVFTTLLASADDIFAKFLLLDNIPELVGHIILTAVVAVGALSLLSRAAYDTDADDNSVFPTLRLGSVEVTAILSGVLLLFTAFVVTQVVVALGGADHVLETEGLTRADHARKGFFQLLWVAGLTVGLVGALRGLRNDEERPDRFAPLALATLALTVIIAAVSFQRLGYYVRDFGLTPLRLWALVGVVAIVIFIGLFCLSIAGWRSSQSWLPVAMVLVIATTVFGLNVINPDAAIANYNIDNFPEQTVDLWTLRNLSEDAVPALVEQSLQFEELRGEVLCNSRPNRSTSFGFLEYNWAESNADAYLDAICPTRIEQRGFGD